ncbi:MAG: hypothetical protein HYU30_00605 [Chloroflexi bacterium]|nr:hypothetical protein [Chloroflexota bacterium]
MPAEHPLLRKTSLCLAALALATIVAACENTTPPPAIVPFPTATPIPLNSPTPTSAPTPAPAPSPLGLRGGVLVTFDVQGVRFRAFITSPPAIVQALALQRGEGFASIPNGRLLPGPGEGNHNAPWSWHLDPTDIHFAEFTIELCDGTPDFVERERDYWLNTVRRYCPWTAKLVEVRDHR